MLTDQEITELFDDYLNANINSGIYTNELIRRKNSQIFGTSYYKEINNQNLLDEIVFGFEHGLFFTSTKFYYFELNVNGFDKYGRRAITRRLIGPFPFLDILKTKFVKEKLLFGKRNTILGPGKYSSLHAEYKDYEVELIESFKGRISTYLIVKRSRLENELQKKEDEYNKRLEIFKGNIQSELDKDRNGEVDLIEINDFTTLLLKNQKKIIDIDKLYVQKFVKISNYLTSKRRDIQTIYNAIINTIDIDEITQRVELIKNQIHSYELILFHSINMVTSLVEENLIVFYEIYERLDEIGIFNSNWENDISRKMSNTENKLIDLLHSINQMEISMINSIDHLTYVTEDSLRELKGSLSRQLDDLNSSVRFNNLLNGIQTYQLYKNGGKIGQ